MQHETNFKTNLFNSTLKHVTSKKPNHKIIPSAIIFKTLRYRTFQKTFSNFFKRYKFPRNQIRINHLYIKERIQ